MSNAEINRTQLEEEIENDSVLVVDALPPAPYRARHLPGARNLTAEDPDDRVREVLPDTGAAIVSYSTDRACDRGPQLADRLSSMGYSNVRIYRDGIEDWVSAGLSVEGERPG